MRRSRGKNNKRVFDVSIFIFTEDYNRTAYAQSCFQWPKCSTVHTVQSQVPVPPVLYIDLAWTQRVYRDTTIAGQVNQVYCHNALPISCSIMQKECRNLCLKVFQEMCQNFQLFIMHLSIFGELVRC